MNPDKNKFILKYPEICGKRSSDKIFADILSQIMLIHKYRKSLNRLKILNTPSRLKSRFRLARIAINTECNLNCIYCFREIHKYRTFNNIMSTEEIIKLMKDVKEAGFSVISISGGEPMLAPGFWQIAEWLSNSGLYWTLATNGHYMDDSAACRLKNLGIDAVLLGLPSTEPDRYKAITGSDRYDLPIKAIENLSRYKILTEATVPLHKYNTNMNEASKIVELSEKYNFYLLPNDCYIEDLQGVDKEVGEGSKTPDFEVQKKTFRKLRGSKPDYRCPLPDHYTTWIAADGEVEACGALSMSFGNVRNEPLRNIMRRQYLHPLFHQEQSGGCPNNTPALRKKYLEGASSLDWYINGRPLPLTGIVARWDMLNEIEKCVRTGTWKIKNLKLDGWPRMTLLSRRGSIKTSRISIGQNEKLILEIALLKDVAVQGSANVFVKLIPDSRVSINKHQVFELCAKSRKWKKHVLPLSEGLYRIEITVEGNSSMLCIGEPHIKVQ